jgi:hypothetical protein
MDLPDLSLVLKLVIEGGVFPALAVICIVLQLRRRWKSTLMLAIGLVVFTPVQLIWTLYPARPTTGSLVFHGVLMLIGLVSFVAAVSGAIWFWRQEAQRRKGESNPTVEKDARKSSARSSL